LSGYGDPMGETTAQLAMSIAAKVDGDCMAALNGIAADMTYDAANIISSAVIADALVKFGENPDGDKVLFIAPAQLAQIRKDINFVSKGDMATDIMMKGTVGELWGCQLVVSDKIKVAGTKFTNYIVKPEALAIYLKRDVELETARDIECKLTVITADQHYAVYLMDESKAIKLTVSEK
ncbi:MAG: N4-gp56 family major capsid protein, partial [Angelakisella sp.]